MADVPSKTEPKPARGEDRRKNDADYAGPEHRKADRRKTEPVAKS